jgi:hypothetical protein
MRRVLSMPAWIEDERRLMDYLVHPHAGHPYVEDLIDAVALMTLWLMVATSLLLVVLVVVDAVLT